MPDKLVQFGVEHGVARIVLDRPQKRNALSRELIAQLAAAVDQARGNDSVRLLTLSAEGSVFCAGMDLAEMQERASQPDATELWQQDTEVYRELLYSLFTLPVPTLAVVPGPALAGGLGLVLACDIVLVAESAYFSLPEPKRGITAAVVSPMLIHRVGTGASTWMLLSGGNISAQDAHRIGLCHELAADAEALAEREAALTASILSCAPSALRMTKELLHTIAASALPAQLDAGMAVSAAARETTDAREGLAAFLGKRKPGWAPE